MKDLDCNVIIKESQDVLSWNEDIYLFHYKQKEEIKRANMCVHMNLVSVVLEGTKEILDHGSKIIVPAGSGFFMKRGSYLITDKVDDPNKGYESIIFFFSDEWLRSQVDNILENVNKNVSERKTPCRSDMVLLPADELMCALISQLKTCLTLNTDPKRLESILPLKIRELFQILISAPDGSYFEEQLRSLDTHLNPDLVRLMQSHYKENISLEQYAFLANYSLSTFKRKFSQTFKMNPGKWIMERRLEEAYNLLRSEMNITEIAYEVGFETPAHFIASFKQKYKNTPKQLQQKL
ncbi:helix-turn-helix transcriptional regulator [Flavobacterium sp. ANB]|uniref:helix-turn-helix domain-containing protein n=1 Tax=Flavobacterium sp. ANB TaxID=2783790 RepID=UPI001889FA04|nr:AraC family transcriptional regulator [Flavobacterium sp. ANB]MBF4519029.1 helix-turn-helix transcriptional regulator [Flavobacterium sp. ANB]